MIASDRKKFWLGLTLSGTGRAFNRLFLRPADQRLKYDDPANIIDNQEGWIKTFITIWFLALSLSFASSVLSAERLTAVYTSIAAAYAPFWVAKDKGIFDKYNLDARLVYMRSTVPTTAALANGDIEFIQSGAAPFINYAARGGDVLLLGCLANKVIDYVFIAHPSIGRMEQLRGRTIGISRAGDQTYYYVRDILKRYGIGLKDVRLVQTGLQPERVAALRQGLVAASILNRPNNLVLEQEGYRRLLDIEDLKLPAGVRCLITTRKLMKARPGLAENFVMSWLESIQFILKQKRETKQIIGKYTQNADDVQLEEAWRSLSTQTEIPPYVSVSQLQGQAAMLAEDQPELNRFDAKKMVDNSVIKKLDDSGWIKKLFGN
jgi:NitT/TauT family transport system substrate-binding protein